MGLECNILQCLRNLFNIQPALVVTDLAGFCVFKKMFTFFDLLSSLKSLSIVVEKPKVAGFRCPQNVKCGQYDWESLKREFMLGDFKTLKEFAQAKNISYGFLRNKAKGWTQE
ncbi:hypothetical protein SAMN04515608_0022, partial [Caldicellulosiruptor bescii]